MMDAADVRSAFWLTFFVEGRPREFRGKSANELPADLSMAFADYVEALARDGEISATLAQTITL